METTMTVKEATDALIEAYEDKVKLLLERIKYLEKQIEERAR